MTKNKKQKYSNFFTNISHPTYIYAFLVFIGFYNYYSYYYYFDIDISSFLSVSELLLSFLPLTYPIIFLVSISVIFYLISIFEGAFDTDHKKEGNILKESALLNKAFNRVTNFIEIKKTQTWRSFITIIEFFALIINLGLLFLVLFFIIIFPLHFLTRLFHVDFLFESHIILLLFFGVIWLYVSDLEFRIQIKKHISPSYYMIALKLSRLILVFVFLIGLITIFNKDKAYKILEGNSTYSIKFDFDGTIKKTDSTLVFVGLTEKYLFLRNLENNSNIIFPIKELGIIEMNYCDEGNIQAELE